MKKSFSLLVIISAITLSSLTIMQVAKWKIAEGYSIKFSSKDPNGVFTSLSGDIIFDENNLEESKFDVSVDVNSINTGNGIQNKHAISEKWLDAETYPEIKFISSEIIKKDDMFEAKGILSMHGVDKEFAIPFTYSNTYKGGLFTGTFEINRNDFNIGKPGGYAAEVINVEVLVPVEN